MFGIRSFVYSRTQKPLGIFTNKIPIKKLIIFIHRLDKVSFQKRTTRYVTFLKLLTLFCNQNLWLKMVKIVDIFLSKYLNIVCENCLWREPSVDKTDINKNATYILDDFIETIQCIILFSVSSHFNFLHLHQKIKPQLTLFNIKKESDLPVSTKDSRVKIAQWRKLAFKFSKFD